MAHTLHIRHVVGNEANFNLLVGGIGVNVRMNWPILYKPEPCTFTTNTVGGGSKDPTSCGNCTIFLPSLAPAPASTSGLSSHLLTVACSYVGSKLCSGLRNTKLGRTLNSAATAEPGSSQCQPGSASSEPGTDRTLQLGCSLAELGTACGFSCTVATQYCSSK